MNNSDPLMDAGAPEIIARPAVVQARPMTFVDAVGVPRRRPNPMRLQSLKPVQAAVDLLVFLGLAIVLVALILGSRAALDTEFRHHLLHGPAAADSTVAENDESATGTGESEDKLQEVDLLPVVLGGLTCSALVLGIGRWRKLPTSSVGLPAFRVTDVYLALAALAAAFAAHLLGVGITMLTWPDAWERMNKSSMNIVEALPPGPLGKYVLMFVAVGFYEELLFRGFILTRVRRLVRSWTLAIILSALGFAALHLDLQEPTALPSLFLLAVTFSIFTVARRSLYPAMIGHWLFNSIQIAALHFLITYGGAPVAPAAQ